MLCRRLSAGWAMSLALIGVVGSAHLQGRSQPPPSPPEVKDPRADDPLRVVAERRKLHIGACANPASLKDAAGAAVLARHFNLLVAENHMKWSFIHPAPDRYAFDPADELVAFAGKNGMAVKGHTFIWHGATPRYLNDL